VECYVCHQPLAAPAAALAPLERWIHASCYGNRPTIAELVMAFLTGCPDEVFCVRCLGDLIGVASAQDIGDALATLGPQLAVGSGTCARCSAIDNVIAARLEPRAPRVRSSGASERGAPRSRRRVPEGEK
jgi:hypothetical protein